MIVECSQCHTKYNVDDDKIPLLGVKVRCRECQNIIFIKKEEPKPAPSPIIPEKPAPPAGPPEPPVPPIKEPTPIVQPPSPEVVMPAAQVPSVEVPRPAAQVPKVEIPTPTTQLPTPEISTPTAPPPVEEPTVIPKPLDPEIPKPPEPKLPAGAERAVIEISKPSPPGLSEEDKKWHDRARRLAKALASDLVLYNRDKVEQGLREGTFVKLLGSEIRRSWEYYCQQIPKHIVESSDYFKEQLNNIVGKGKQIFK